MRKVDVVIGGLYRAKVGGDVVVVRVTGENIYGGWNARSLASGRLIRVRSAQRLRERVDESAADFASWQRGSAYLREHAHVGGEAA